MLPGVITLLVAIVGLWVIISSLWEKNTDEELDKFLDEDFDKLLANKEEKEKLVLRPKKKFSSLDHIAQKKPYKEKAVLRKSPKLPDRKLATICQHFCTYRNTASSLAREFSRQSKFFFFSQKEVGEKKKNSVKYKIQTSQDSP